MSESPQSTSADFDMKGLICWVIAIGLVVLSYSFAGWWNFILPGLALFVVAFGTGDSGNDEALRKELYQERLRSSTAIKEAESAEMSLSTLKADFESGIAREATAHAREMLRSLEKERDEANARVESLKREVAQLKGAAVDSDVRHRKEVETGQQALKAARAKAAADLDVTKIKINNLTGELKTERERTEAFIAERIDQMDQLQLVEFINHRVGKVERSDLTGDDHTAMVRLQARIETLFADHRLGDVNRLIEFDQNVFRIDEYETIIDQFMSKITTARLRTDIDEDEREEQISNWRRLLDREIAAMEGTA